MSVYQIRDGYIHDDCYLKATASASKTRQAIDAIRPGMPRGQHCMLCDGAGPERRKKARRRS